MTTRLTITQVERRPLQRINKFLRNQGLKCYIETVTTKKGKHYELRCGRKCDVNKIINNTEEYYLTKRKRVQVENFKWLLKKYPDQ